MRERTIVWPREKMVDAFAFRLDHARNAMDVFAATQERMVARLRLCDAEYGQRVADGLGFAVLARSTR